MSSITIPYRFVVKRDTAANFTAANTLLLSGEFGLETDTRKMKMGDGITAWNALPYIIGGLAGDTAQPAAIVAGTATLDAALSHYFTLSLTANATLAVSNPPTGAECLIVVVEQTGSFTLALGAGMTTITGTTFAMPTGAGKKVVLGLMTLDGGTSYLVAVGAPA